MDKIAQEVDALYKSHFGKIVASLLYASSSIDPETAEDVVQDSFTSALTDWKQNGIPTNKIGWIYKVCRNKALNRIKRDKRVEALSDRTKVKPFELRFSESAMSDQQLTLLFACAHPDLSPKSQVVITLKYVMNLKIDAIAKALCMTVDGIDKLLFRARQKIKEDRILLREPHALALIPRLPIVHKIIYLTFNEGYKSLSNDEILRNELCEEALLLNKSLLDSSLANKDTLALYALMLFNSARFDSRFSATGELLDLEQQDRSLWNQDLIFMARDFLRRSQDDVVSSYHLEAGIACMHCTSRSFESTDWRTIVGLYARLLKDYPNPFIELNYAIALYYYGDKISAFSILNELERHPFLNQYYLLNSALGKLYLLEGNDELAKHYLVKAFNQTHLSKEKDFIQRMINGLG